MFRWIKRHKAATGIIAVSLALCIIISISYIRGDLGGVSDKIQQGNAVVAQPLYNVADGIKSGIKGITGFKGLLKENERLKEEVDSLEEEIIKLKLQRNELSELRELSNALNYESLNENYTATAANIISMDNSNYFNIFTVNIGEEKGVKKDSVVIAGGGIVGKVSETGEGYSKIISIVDGNSEISFEVVRDMGILGVLSGDGKGGLMGFTFDGNAGIVEGDMLITTGIGLYPEGIEIGKVTSVEYNNDTQLKTITAEPSINFKSLKKVMVLI